MPEKEEEEITVAAIGLSRDATVTGCVKICQRKRIVDGCLHLLPTYPLYPTNTNGFWEIKVFFLVFYFISSHASTNKPHVLLG